MRRQCALPLAGGKLSADNNFLAEPWAIDWLAFCTMHTPVDIQLVGSEVAIRWSDGRESFLPSDRLRAASPSAETQGERDIFGNQYGGGGSKQFDGVTVLGWEGIGNYAIRFEFSDGHRTGLYSFDLLRDLSERHS